MEDISNFASSGTVSLQYVCIFDESGIMATTIRIADDVMVVLKRSTITETSLQLPDEQLERSLYSRVNKIIEAAGGKWNKKAKAHVFPNDPREALGMAIETGKVDNKQQIFQQFFTPSAVAEMMCRDVQEGDAVLEPSAGAGSIAMAAAAKGAAVVCFELQADLAEKLETLGFNCTAADFLQITPLPIYDRVLMNPPFTKGQFQLHVQHAFKFLNAGGTLKAIGPANLGGNTTKAQKAFMTWLNTLTYEIYHLPVSTFRAEGTNIDTVILTITN